MKLMSEVNTSLAENVFEEDQSPGELRTEGNAGAGTHKAPMDVHDSDHWAFEYANGDEVEREMLNLCRWVSARIKAGDDPIEKAGLACQRMVSIHPFHDGNGRSSRFLTDLRSEGLSDG